MEDLFYFHQLKAAFSDHADQERAVRMKAYMRNQFEFFGIESPIRKKIVSGILSENGKPELPVLIGLTGLLWSQPEREMQYAAMDINNYFLKKLIPAYMPIYEKLIGQKSWWDTVDWLAPRAMGSLFLRYPEHIDRHVENWLSSGNIWYIRSAILFQLHYKKHTDFELLKSIILQTIGSTEFFINKASGWALREYSKTNASAVTEFVESTPALSGLTKTEALKWLKRGNTM
ncbi:MAG TPA: DNA alkylation repair protein, partial [Saprospirales bacterium]|nr:DNA alkylation repair protein [Saprospirales bacterium]